MQDSQEQGDLPSSIESAWHSGSNQQALTPTQATDYDPEAMMFHVSQGFRHLVWPEETVELPAVDFLRHDFARMVKGSIEARTDFGDCPPHPDTIKATEISDTIVSDYCVAVESLIYGGQLDSILQDKSLSNEEKCVQILCHPVLGNKRNTNLVAGDRLLAHIRASWAERLPLQFVLPAFPFKDQNPFRTYAAADHVDLGDIALLIRLHGLALALEQVYPFDVHWIVVSDGISYSPIFNVSAEDADRYLKKLRQWRNRLNLSKTVHLLSLDSLTNRFGTATVRLPSGQEEALTFDAISEAIGQSFRRLLVTGDDDFNDTHSVLARGMRWNINSSHMLQTYSWSDLWRALCGTSPANAGEGELSRRLDEMSSEAAIRYASFNLTMRYVRLLERFLPHALRATVHPKRDQIAIPSIGQLYPWNGVAVVAEGAMTAASVGTAPLYTMLRHESVSARRLYGDADYFYYTTAP